MPDFLVQLENVPVPPRDVVVSDAGSSWHVLSAQALHGDPSLINAVRYDPATGWRSSPW